MATVSATFVPGTVADHSTATVENPPYADEIPQQRDACMGWWRDAKYGLFIHCGVYSVPEGKYGDRAE